MATPASLRLAPSRFRQHRLTNTHSLHKILEKVAECPSSRWGTQNNLDVLFPPVNCFLIIIINRFVIFKKSPYARAEFSKLPQLSASTERQESNIMLSGIFNKR